MKRLDHQKGWAFVKACREVLQDLRCMFSGGPGERLFDKSKR